MIEPYHRRIAGMHIEADGVVGVVWLAQDPDTSVALIYDTALFRSEPPVVIYDAIASRGRWIPIAWPKSAKEFADKLLDHGLNMLPEPVSDQQTAIEQHAKTVYGAFKARRLRIRKHLGEWHEEYKTYYRDDTQVPTDGFPLMSATRHAVEQLEYAQAQITGRKSQNNYPELKGVI